MVDSPDEIEPSIVRSARVVRMDKQLVIARIELYAMLFVQTNHIGVEGHAAIKKRSTDQSNIGPARMRTDQGRKTKNF